MKRLCIFMIVLFLFSGRAEAGSPLSPEAKEWFQKGYQAFQAGQDSTAIWYYEKVVDADPNFAPVYNALGLAHQKHGDPMADVLWYFRVAVDIDPNYQEPYENMCRYYYQAQQFKECEAVCKKLLELNPDSRSAKMQLAWNYLVGLREPAEAIHYFQEVSTFVKKPVVYFGLGMAYSMNGNYAEALGIITKLREMGADEFAVQLENVTRSASYSPAVGPQKMMILPEKSGTVISAHPPEGKTSMPESSEDKQSHPAPIGTMRVRLRGKLTPPPGGQSSDMEDNSHPGTLTPAERIRQLRGDSGRHGS